MATWTIKIASFSKPDDIFNQIVSGAKTIETRSYDPNDPRNYSTLRSGDKLVFVSKDTGRTIRKTATFMHKYTSVADMAYAEPVDKISPSLKLPSELIEKFEINKKKWGGEYAYNIENYGVIAIGFE